MAKSVPPRGGAVQKVSRSALLSMMAVAVLVAGALSYGNWLVAHPTPSTDRTGSAVMGPADAPLQIEIFEDYQCPWCAQAARTIEPNLLRDYVDTGKARVVVHDLTFIGPESAVAAQAAICAGKQNQFWAFHETLFREQHGENKGFLTQDQMVKFASQLGLKQDEFTTCLNAPDTIAAAKAENKKADDMGVKSTPTFVINGQLVEGPPNYAYVKKILETVQQLKK